MKHPIIIGDEAFHCPEHPDQEMTVIRYGQEPDHGITYGIWRCPADGALWYEDEDAEEWERWTEW